MYESDKLLAEYLLFHYGTAEEVLPGGGWPEGMRAALGFTRRTVAQFENIHVDRGLDLGCAVGGSTFAMAETCDEVTGIDFSHSFIRAATLLAQGGEIPYLRHDEGNISTPLVARARCAGNTHFLHGDAMNLPEDLGSFDRVHAANLLCRLPQPEKLLGRLPSLVKPGGLLVLATPCTWLEEFTPRENWPETTTRDWLEKHLAGSFTLEKETDEPFLIRETARKFQWSRSLVTVWRRS